MVKNSVVFMRSPVYVGTEAVAQLMLKYQVCSPAAMRWHPTEQAPSVIVVKVGLLNLRSDTRAMTVRLWMSKPQHHS
jgi:hypothetical protein